MIAGIARLKKRREEVERFDPLSVTDQHNTPALDALEAAVDEALVRTFGADTLDYDRYKYAKDFDRGRIITLIQCLHKNFRHLLRGQRTVQLPFSGKQ